MSTSATPVRASRGAIWRHRLRVVEAMVLLAVFGLAQRAVPMRRWSGVLGSPVAPPQPWLGTRVATLPSRAANLTEARAARAVRRASRVLPWSPTCLAEAAAGQVLLRQLGQPGVVVIGLRAPSTSGAKWDAHAWLMGRSGALTGGPAAAGFTATTVYEVRGALSAAEAAVGSTA